MRRSWTIFATALVATGGAYAMATPTQAGWRDYMGKTIIAVVETVHSGTSRTVGDSSPPTRSRTACTRNDNVYISSRGRLFYYVSVSQCDGREPFRPDEPSGMVFDLNEPEGTFETEYISGSYAMRETATGVEITMPQEDRVMDRAESRSIFTNATGFTKLVIDFDPECSVTWSGSTAYRHEFRYKTSDYYSHADVTSEQSSMTISCSVVEGFR